MREINRESVDYYDVVIDKETGKVKDFRGRHISEPPKNELEQWFYDYYQAELARINALPAKLEAERALVLDLFGAMTETPALINAASEQKPILKLFND